MKKIIWLMIIGGVLGTILGFLLPFFPPINLTFFTSQTILMGLLIGFSALIFTYAYLQRKQKIKESHRASVLAEEKQAIATKLHENQTSFDTIFSHTNVGIALLDLNGCALKVNPAFLELFGFNEEEICSIDMYTLLHGNDSHHLQNQIQQLIDKKISTYHSEQQCFRKNGDLIWIVLTLSLIRNNTDKPVFYIVQVQNITLQKKAEERLRHMAYHDPLTGLANRNKIEQFINHILASSRRHQLGFALLFLDLDRFKTINDTIGHEAGDLLLQIVAERLRNAIRNTDMVARLGGDEFVLLISDVKKTESVALVAQKILSSILEVIVIKGQEIYITTSIGISFYPYDGQNLQTLMKNADLALYRAKEHGRNNFQFYTYEMTSRAQEKLTLENALGHALVKDEFILNYQPKMELKTRRISGVEALLRWQNKDYGLIAPDEIIMLAEETGLIIPVSEWILHSACTQLKKWHGMGFTSLSVAVNCSARQFKQPTFVDEIQMVINEFGIQPACLEIEVTESTIMQDPENTLRVLYALKDLGVQIVIDDFGTGYWSLSNLRRLSVDKIKIDRTFIKQATADDTSAAITRAIIAMVNKLGIKSVAEGVETREQYEFLEREGCIEIQGYYLTKPLTDAAMSNFLKHPIPDAEVINRDQVITE